MAKDLPYWVGFSRVRGIGPRRFKMLVDRFESVGSAWRASAGRLRAAGLDRRSIASLLQARQELDLEAEMQQLEANAITVLTWDDPDYPSLLRSIPDPPFILYIRGELLPQDDWALAVVGTRYASVYGKEVTRQLVAGLASGGVTVISGLARGIDTAAHRAAVEVGGRTVAVLGSGVDVIYPAQNRKLAERILENGALVSEYPLGTQPEAGNFPRRNRIISGLSLGVLIVEGAENSGARITTNFALEQGREVLAVPGNILARGSRGPNRLIQQGAKLVTSVGDILEELNLTMVEQHSAARAIIPENETEALLLQHLSAEPQHVDDLGRRVNLPAAEIASTLTMMELKGQVRQVGGMNYVLARELPAGYRIE
ncbi:MAG: DNA-processing protein DprA [Anaerolineae bacterium]